MSGVSENAIGDFKDCVCVLWHVRHLLHNTDQKTGVSASDQFEVPSVGSLLED